MKKGNRLFALLLSVMMVFTYMPAMAFAEGEEPTDNDPAINTEEQSGDEGTAPDQTNGAGDTEAEGPKWHVVDEFIEVPCTTEDEKLTLTFDVDFDEYTDAGIEPPELSYEWHQHLLYETESLGRESSLEINNPGPKEDDGGDEFYYYCNISSGDGQTGYVRFRTICTVIATDLVFESVDGTDEISIPEHKNGDYYSDAADDWVDASDENAYYYYFIDDCFADGDRLIATVAGDELVYTYNVEDHGFFDTEGNSLFCDITTAQSYDNQWVLGGDYYCTIGYGGYEIEVPVHIVEAEELEEPEEQVEPEESEDTRVVETMAFKRANGDTVQFEEGSFGYMDTNPAGEEFFRYWTEDYLAMFFDDGDELTLKYEDYDEPVVYTYYGMDLENHLEMSFSRKTDDGSWDIIDYSKFEIESNQTEAWEIGGEGYTFTLSYKDQSVDIPVEIIENSVESISFSRDGCSETSPVELIENVDGFTDAGVDPEDGSDVNYFCYSLEYLDGDVLTVDYIDGTSTEYVYSYEDGTFVASEDKIDPYADSRFSCDSDQSYENQWKQGEDHFFTIGFNGKTCNVAVTIKEGIVGSVEFERPGLEGDAIEIPQLADDDDGYYCFNFEAEDLLKVQYRIGDNLYSVTYTYVDEERDGELVHFFETKDKGYPEEIPLTLEENDAFWTDMYGVIGQPAPEEWTLNKVYNCELSYIGKTFMIPVKIVGDEPVVDPVEESEKYATETLGTADEEVVAAKESSGSALAAADALNENSEQGEIDAAKETAAKAVEDAQKAIEAAQTALDAAQAYYDAAKEAYDKANASSAEVEVNDIRLSALDVSSAVMLMAEAEDLSAEDVLKDAETKLAAAKYNKAAASNTLANAEKAYAKIASVNTTKAIAKAEEVANDPNATEAEKTAAVKAAQDAAKEAAEHAANAEAAAKETATLVEAANADENLDADRAGDMKALVEETSNSTQEATEAKTKAEEDQKAADKILEEAEAQKKSDAAKKVAEEAAAAMEAAKKVADEAKAAAETARKAAEAAGQTPGEAALAAAKAAVKVAEENSAAAAALKDMADKAKTAADEAKAAAKAANDSEAAKAAEKLAEAADKAKAAAETAVADAKAGVEKAKTAAANAETAAKNEAAAVEKAKTAQATADKSAQAASDAKTAAADAKTAADAAKKTADEAKAAADKATPGTAEAVEAAQKAVDAAKKSAEAAEAAQKAADAYQAAADKAKADAQAANDAASATHDPIAKKKAADSVKTADAAVADAKTTAAEAKTAADDAKSAVTTAENAKKTADEAKANTGTPEITLSATDYTYKYKVKKVKVGKKKKKQAVATAYVPSIASVKLNGKTLTAADYDASYSDPESKALGTYTVTVTLKGKYKGTGTATYNINPKAAKISKPSKGKKKMTVKWKKASKNDIKYKALDGYEIQYSLSKDFSSDDTRTKTASKKAKSKSIKKLQSKQVYYVRIRTYKKVGSMKLYSNWSAVKSVKVK